MKCLVLCLCVAAALCHSAAGRQMAGLTESQPRELKSMKLSQFKWKDCTLPGSPLAVHTLEVSPDPILLPGQLHVNVTASSRVEMVAPIAVDTHVWRQHNSGSWEKVPCVEHAGTCHYDDVCEMLAQKYPPSKPCPPEFKQLKMSCRCPFRQGTFALNETFPLPRIPWYVPKSMVDGNYHVVANATTKTGANMCLEMWTTVHCQ